MESKYCQYEVYEDDIHVATVCIESDYINDCTWADAGTTYYEYVGDCE